MPKSTHYLVVETPSGELLMPRDHSYQFQNWRHAFWGIYEYHDSNFDGMKQVLERICGQAQVEIKPRSIEGRQPFRVPGSPMDRIIITAILLSGGPNRGYFMPLQSHPEADMLHERLGIPRPKLQAAE